MSKQPLTMFRSFEQLRWADVEPSIFVKRSEVPQSLLAAEANTLGWDTVNAIRLPIVNQTLTKSDLYPKTFNQEMQPTWKIDGTFDSWQLIMGGSGAILFMKAPIKQGHMTFTGIPELNFTNGYVAFSIKLKYLPQPPVSSRTETFAELPAPVNGGTPQFLARDEQPRSVDDPAVVIQSMNYGGTTVDATQDALFRGAIMNWFNANLDKFTYIFTVVNINALAAKEAFQWLKPTYTSYAYFNGSSEDSSYFGVLNMTSQDSAEGLTNQLPPSAIPTDCNASLLVSNEKFLRNMVLPGLTKAFTRATQSNFIITNNDTMIEKTSSDIQLDDIKVGALYYTPYLENFTYQVIGDEIQINSKTRVNVSPGIDVFVTATSYYGIKLVNKPDGSGQTLDFYETRPGKTEHYYTKAAWVTVTEIIVGIIGAVAGAVAGNIIKTVARKIIALIIIAIVMGLLAALPEIIARVMEGEAADALPPIGPLVADATGDIRWPDSTGFTPISAQLNGSFQLGGNLAYPNS